MLIDIKKIRRVHLKAGEVVVLTTGALLERHQMEYLQSNLKEIFPNNMVIVLAPTEKIEVLSPEEVAERGR